MEGREPPPGALAGLFPGVADGGEPPHVVAVAAQECLRGIGPSLILPSCHDRWAGAIAAHLTRAYRTFGAASLGALHVCVFARSDVARFIPRESVEAPTVATGPLGAANKGGAAVAFVVGDADAPDTPSQSLLFVSAHLPHGDGEARAEARSADLGTVLASLNVGPWGAAGVWRELHRVRAGRVRGGQAAWTAWREAPVTFAPTYKMAKDPGTGAAIPDRYSPSRPPSWTDRVLVRQHPAAEAQGALALDRYRACAVPGAASDHRPVSLSLTVPPPAEAVGRLHRRGDGAAPRGCIFRCCGHA